MKSYKEMKEELNKSGKYYPKHWTVDDIGDYLYKIDPEFRIIRAKQRAEKSKGGTNGENTST
jgi:hypothetical protein